MTEPRRPRDSRPSGRAPAHRARPSRSGNSRLIAVISVVAGAAILVLGAGIVLGASDHHTAERAQPAINPPPQPKPGGPSPEAASGSTEPASPGAGTAETSSAVAAGPARPVIALADNPINDPGLSARPTECALPPFDSSDPGQEIFYQAALSCLNTTWEPILRSANLPFHSPRVTVVSSEVETPCGTRSTTQTALYCAGTLYMTGGYYRDIEGHGDTAGVYFGQLAHEYAHHIQELAGIMDASWQQRGRIGAESPAAYENSRRFELQATCYGGMFLAAVRNQESVSPTLIEQALSDAGQRGDYPDGRSPDHGRPELNAVWARQGHEKNATYQCNTWLAAPETVQ